MCEVRPTGSLPGNAYLVHSGWVTSIVSVLLSTYGARARSDNVALMRCFGTSSPWVSFDRGPYEMHAWVGTIRVDVITSGVFAHD